MYGKVVSVNDQSLSTSILWTLRAYATDGSVVPRCSMSFLRYVGEYDLRSTNNSS